jgi:hypothetical protein
MGSTKTESRRTFLQALFGTAAGGAAMAGITACGAAGASGDGVSYRVGETAAAEVVPLRPGVQYAGSMPSRVPVVRTLASAGAIF